MILICIYTAYLTVLLDSWLVLHLKFRRVYIFNNWMEFLDTMYIKYKSDGMPISPEVFSKCAQLKQIVALLNAGKTNYYTDLKCLKNDYNQHHFTPY